jgi:hypothetical protein
MSDLLGTSSSGADSAGATEMGADLDALDLGSDEATTATEDTPEAPEAETPQDSESELATDLDSLDEAEPVDDVAPLDIEGETPAEPPKDENGEELPEGVQVREKNGKKEWVWPEGRAKGIYAGYKNALAAEGILGEELTTQAIETRHNAWLDQEAMISDYLSGEPGAEGRFLGQLANWAKTAQDNGEVQHNPLRNIAHQLPKFFIEQGDTASYEAMAVPVFRHELDQLYEEAAAPGNEDLFASVQRIDNRLFGRYKKREEVSTQADPLAKREAEIAARENKLKEADTKRRQGEYSAWQDTTTAKMREAISAGIIDRLGPDVLKSYEKFPTELQGVKDLLRNEFHASLKKDPAWQQYLANQTRKAANAPTPAVRDAISADLETRSKAKAIYWADPQRNPRVKEILSQRAAAIKATSDARHQRHAVGAARRDPGAVGVPVKRTVQQTPNGRSTADNWAEAIDAL